MKLKDSVVVSKRLIVLMFLWVFLVGSLINSGKANNVKTITSATLVYPGGSQVALPLDEHKDFYVPDGNYKVIVKGTRENDGAAGLWLRDKDLVFDDDLEYTNDWDVGSSTFTVELPFKVDGGIIKGSIDSSGEKQAEIYVKDGSVRAPTGYPNYWHFQSYPPPGNGTDEPEPESVGGIVASVDKFALISPYIGFASTVLAATVASTVYVKRVKRRREKQ